MKRSAILGAVAVMVTFLGFAMGPLHAQASSYVVANSNDSGPGSLREAVGFAIAAGGSNTITFAGSANGKITLTSGQLDITGSTLTITGNGTAKTILDGLSLNRVFKVESGATLNLANMTLQHGKPSDGSGGGGLYAFGGSATITNSLLTNDDSNGFNGGGILNDGSGTVTVSTTTFVSDTSEANGGGVANQGTGTLNLIGDTLTNNQGDVLGAAVFSSGTLNVTDTTISGNTAKVGGGGIATNGGSSVTNILYSTLDHNADGGTGGDFYGAATGSVRGSIFGNASGGTCHFLSGSVTDGGYNIDQSSTCGFSAGTDKQNTNPLTNALAANGGPTQTESLQNASPAIDAGETGSGCTGLNGGNDQRGLPRPDDTGTACDIGAFEFGGGTQPLSPYSWDSGLFAQVSPDKTTVHAWGRRNFSGAWGTQPLVNYQAGATTNSRLGSSGTLTVTMSGTYCPGGVCAYGGGSGYKGLVQFWNDPNNYIAFGLIHDPGVSPSGTTIMVEGAGAGVPVGGYWANGAITGTTHTIKVTWTASTITFTLDNGVPLGPYPVAENNPSISFLAAARNTGDICDTTFSNILFG